MKNLSFKLSILALAILIFTSCTKKDPCEDITCINGGKCDDGTCLCPAGYEGTTCEKLSLPKVVKVSSIKFLKIPAKKSDGNNWDADNTNPDVEPRLYSLKSDNKTLDAVLWTSNFTVLNAKLDGTASMSLVLPEFKITPVDKLYALAIWDKDDNAAEFMGAISFNFKDLLAGSTSRPSTVKIDCSTCTLAFELSVSYEF